MPYNPKTPYLFRIDGGNDSFDTIVVLNNSGHFFLIKLNLRKEMKVQWLDTKKSLVSTETPREGKRGYTGAIIKGHSKCDKRFWYKQVNIAGGNDYIHYSTFYKTDCTSTQSFTPYRNNCQMSRLKIILMP